MSDGDHDLTLYRIDQLEKAVATMAHAAHAQIEFNTTVEKFMASVRTWGAVAMIVYSTAQAVGLVMLAYGINQTGG
jgi:hypothetical protein